MSGDNTRLSRGAAALATVFVALLAQRMAGQTPAAPQQFEARSELVLVDVSVLDSRGRQVPDLAAGDFTLEVEGRRRTIESAQFIATPPSSDTTEPASAREASTSTNAASDRGRLLLIVVDEGHLRVGATRAVLRAAEGLLERVAPGDFVALARMPDGRGGVEFTNDHARVLSALRAVVGRQTDLRRLADVTLTEAADYENGQRDAWPTAIARRCPPPSLEREHQACVSNLESDARQIILDHHERTAQTLGGLEGLIDRLRPLDRPVHLVLISEGLYIEHDRNRITSLASRTAGSRVTLSVVRPSPQLFDATTGSRISSQDDELLRGPLETLASQSRGSFYALSGSGGTVFERISDGWSGYYLLGFEPTDDDRTGRNRRIKVEVGRRGLTVRARPSFAIRRENDAPRSAVDRLSARLAAPLPSAGMPIRVASYVAPHSVDGQVRVIVSAEIGEPGNAAVVLPVGLLLVDADGRIVMSSVKPEVELRPALAAKASQPLFLTSFAVPPGDYMLRVGAVNGDGAIGVTHHAVSARLRSSAGGLALSDLVVANVPSPGDSIRPSASVVVDGDQIAALVEGQHQDASVLDGVQVRFDVTSPGQTNAVASARSAEGERSAGRRSFVGRLALGELPPGEYVLRAVVEMPAGPATSMARPFRLERSGTAAAPAAGVATAGGEAVVGPAAAPPVVNARFVMPLQRFSMDEVLRPAVVDRFLAGLEQRHTPSPAVRSLLEQARRGKFSTASAAAGSADEVFVSFVGALAALREGQLPRATALIQQTLRRTPDFVGLAFYLGATHAAAGRDPDAVGAWRMSLLSDESQAAYPLLVDALLRSGDPQRALETLERTPETMRSSRDARRREVLAAAALGRYEDVLPKVEALVAEQPADLDLLLVGVQVLQRLHVTQPLDAARRARLDEWASRYLDANGPQRALVIAWRQSVAGK